MFYEVDLLNIYITNLMAITLLVIMFISNFWRLKIETYENRTLVNMIIVAVLGSSVIILSYYVDGKTGNGFRFLVYFSNSLLYILNMIIAYLWMIFIETHVRFKPSTRSKVIFAIPMVIGFIIIFINLFTPVSFSVDEANVYHREPLYFAFLAIDIGYTR